MYTRDNGGKPVGTAGLLRGIRKTAGDIRSPLEGAAAQLTGAYGRLAGTARWPGDTPALFHDTGWRPSDTVRCATCTDKKLGSILRTQCATGLLLCRIVEHSTCTG